jgi:hypothetical protein
MKSSTSGALAEARREEEVGAGTEDGGVQGKGERAAVVGRRSTLTGQGWYCV